MRMRWKMDQMSSSPSFKPSRQALCVCSLNGTQTSVGGVGVVFRNLSPKRCHVVVVVVVAVVSLTAALW